MRIQAFKAESFQHDAPIVAIAFRLHLDYKANSRGEARAEKHRLKGMIITEAVETRTQKRRPSSGSNGISFTHDRDCPARSDTSGK
jgi:hypothetical protein